MRASLWDLASAELLGCAASSDPTPGGGAIAAVTAAFGLGLVEMAIEVTVCASADAEIPAWRLGEPRRAIRELRSELVKPAIVSDVRGGRELRRGATLAALRTVDINLAALEERGNSDAAALRERRDAALHAVTSLRGGECRPA